MSISGVSSNSSTYQVPYSNFIQLLQDCASEGKSLQTGDPPSAQKLFDQLQADGGMSASETQSCSSSSQSNGTNDPFQTLLMSAFQSLQAKST
jgi:hypothetical protein